MPMLWDLFDYDGLGLFQIQRVDDRAPPEFTDGCAVRRARKLALIGRRYAMTATALHQRDKRAIRAARRRG